MVAYLAASTKLSISLCAKPINCLSDFLDGRASAIVQATKQSGVDDAVHRWQELSWNLWVEQRLSEIPTSSIRRIVELLEPSIRTVWLNRLYQTIPATAAVGVKHWLAQLSPTPIILVGGLQWDMVQTAEGALIAFPKALGGDPLAMAGAIFVWAGHDLVRLKAALGLAGAAALPAIWSAGWVGPRNDELWTSYATHYRTHGQNLKISEMTVWFGEMSSEALDFSWPLLPAFEPYVAQLAYGVVPHDPGGRSPLSDVAVLLALHQFDGQERLRAAGLAHKAIEGRLLANLWDQAAGHEEGGKTW